jgi:hypothetical protein
LSDDAQINDPCLFLNNIGGQARLKKNSVGALDLARGAAGAGLILRKHDESAVVSLCMITTLLYLPLSSWNE